MTKPDSKYDKIAMLFQALANPTRIRILDALISNCMCSKEGCCVSHINSVIELPQPYVSKHLKILKECGILTYKKEANKIFYSFNNSQILDDLIEYLKKCRKCC
jgi:ArsR family transcriptional regulator